MGLTPSGGKRDGEASALQQQALDEGAAAVRPGKPTHRPIQPPGSIIQSSLAQKVLHGWMQNRHQTLYPLVLSLRNMTEVEKRLIVGAMAFALQAGELDGQSEQRAEAWLRSVGGGTEEIATLAGRGAACCMSRRPLRRRGTQCRAGSASLCGGGRDASPHYSREMRDQSQTVDIVHNYANGLFDEVFCNEISSPGVWWPGPISGGPMNYSG